MTPATAKKSTAALSLTVLCLVLATILALVLAGCGGSAETSTTTSVTDSTTTTAEPSTSTSDTEATTSTTGSSFPPTVGHEQDDTRFIYSGKWTTVAAKSASGGDLDITNASGCKVTIRFYGDGASWIAKKSPQYGEAEVTLDDGASQTVDLYSATAEWKQKVWKSGSLELGDHTLVISWTGKKNEKAEATNINVDNIIISGVLTGTVQQTYTLLKYAGTWSTITSSSASGGTFKQADKSGASVTIKFSGIKLVWIGRTGPGYGQAKVSIDGGPDATVDTKLKMRVLSRFSVRGSPDAPNDSSGRWLEGSCIGDGLGHRQ